VFQEHLCVSDTDTLQCARRVQKQMTDEGVRDGGTRRGFQENIAAARGTAGLRFYPELPKGLHDGQNHDGIIFGVDTIKIFCTRRVFLDA